MNINQLFKKLQLIHYKIRLVFYYIKRDESPMSFPCLPDNFLYHEFLQYQAIKVVYGYKIMAKDYKEKQKLQNQLLRINTAIRSIKQISNLDKKQEGKLMKLKKQQEEVESKISSILIYEPLKVIPKVIKSKKRISSVSSRQQHKKLK